MTDQIQGQDVELDLNNEVVEEAHDPKNAEAQSIDSVDKAGDATGKAARGDAGGNTAKDNTKQDPAPKTKAGIINAMYSKMGKMKKADLQASYKNLMGESFDFDEEEVVAVAPLNFKEDLDALVTNDESLSEDFKTKAATIFEAAVSSRVHETISEKTVVLEAAYAEKVEALEENFATEMAEGLSEAKGELVEKIDNYLNYVVETWMEDNKLAVERGLRTEIAETFMSKMKDLFVESYIEVPEAKIDLVDDLAEQVEELEALLNKETAANIAMKESVEALKRTMIIRESAKDLAETQVAKLEKLAENLDFDNAESFTSRVTTLKESYFSKSVEEAEEVINEAVEEAEEADSIVESNTSMDRYLTALRTSN